MGVRRKGPPGLADPDQQAHLHPTAPNPGQHHRLTAAAETEPDATGAVWKLQARDRDLDSNVIALPAGGGIDWHAGPDLDVLIHVLSGSGRLTTINRDARKRLLTMRRTFREHRDRLTAVAIVARKPEQPRRA